MDQSPANMNTRIGRRKFIRSAGSILAFGGFAFSASCRSKSGGNKQYPLAVDFIGTDQSFGFYKMVYDALEHVLIRHCSLEESTTGESEAVHIAGPLDSRGVEGFMSLEKNKHVLFENPMGTSYAEFDAVQKTANKLNLRIGLIDPWRYMAATSRARDMVYREEIGRIIKIEITANSLLGPGNREVGGYTGSSVFLIRLASWILHGNPAVITVTRHTLEDPIKTDPGLCFETIIRRTPVFFHGDEHLSGWTMQIAGEGRRLILNGHGELHSIGEMQEKELIPAGTDHENQALRDNIGDFVQSVRTGKEPEINSLDGMHGITLNQAAYESARTGKQVKMIM